ncbi:MAG: hypothetical protein WCT31_02335 [Candidatus Micrarchaeia archaeon]|jgi:hypothetical protein
MKKLLILFLVAGLIIFGCVSNKTSNAGENSLKEVSKNVPVSINTTIKPVQPPQPPPENLTPKDETKNETKNQTAATVADNKTAGPALPSDRLLNWTEIGKVLDEGVSTSTYLWGDGKLRMYYTGMGIALAESTNGISFSKKGAVLDSKGTEFNMFSNQVIIKLKDGKYRMIYEGQTGDKWQGNQERKFYSAISNDGILWERESGIRYSDYSEGRYSFASVPDIIEMNRTLVMYYTSGLKSGIAISNDEGLAWTKKSVIDLPFDVVLDPDIVQLSDGTYKLFFTSFPSGEFGMGNQVILSASSLDGFNFVLDSGNRMICDCMLVDPDVIEYKGDYLMYYAKFIAGNEMSDVYVAKENKG